MGDQLCFRDQALRYQVRDGFFREKRSSKSDFSFPTYPLKEPFPAYESEEFRLNSNMYRRNEPKIDVNESAVENFVHRVLLSALVSESGEDGYGIMSSDDGHVLRSENSGPNQDSPCKERKSRPRKQDRKGKRGKRGDNPREKRLEDYLVNDGDDKFGGGVHLNIPLSDFRKYVFSEVESRARAIHDFYSFHHDKVQNDRMEAYGSILIWRDKFHQVEDRLIRAEKDMNVLKADHDQLQAELESIKNAKRKRRKDAKIRKNKQTVCSHSDETTINEDFHAPDVRSE